MEKDEIEEVQGHISHYLDDDDMDNAIECWDELISNLFEEKKYIEISRLYNTKEGKILGDHSFEVAYALASLRKNNEAEKIYRNILEGSPENSSVLNNLSNILKEKKEFEEAFLLISRAKDLDSNDDIINNNYNSLTKILDDISRKEERFLAASESIKNENKFVRDKLLTFLNNIFVDDDFENNKIPIPNWKFRTLIRTDETKAESLKKQWLQKGYIYNTGEKADRFIVVYEINPYIQQELEEKQSKEIDANWIKGIEQLSIENLEGIEFYEYIKKIKRISLPYRKIILRDFKELVINYLFSNYKTVIILSGSIVETLLIYYCEKSKIEKIEYTRNKRSISKKLFDCDLGDLLNFFEDRNLFKKQIMHLGNLSRLFRNFIHPGKELRDEEELDKNKAELCFITLKELIKAVI